MVSAGLLRELALCAVIGRNPVLYLQQGVLSSLSLGPIFSFMGHMSTFVSVLREAEGGVPEPTLIIGE